MANAFWEDIRTYWEKAMSEDISNSMLWAAKADNHSAYIAKHMAHELATRVDANSLKLQSQAGGYVGDRGMACGSIVPKQMSDQYEIERLGQTNFILKNALNRHNGEISEAYGKLANLALAYSNQQTEIDNLKAERDKLLAERAAFNDALADACKSRPYQSRETRNISRAIGNTDFGNSKLGLPLHDRY